MNGNGTKESTKASGAGRLNSADVDALARGVIAEPEVSLIERVRRAMFDHNLSQKEAALQSSIGPAVFNQWLQGKYQGDVAKADAKALRWLRGLGDRASIAQLMPNAPEYFESETGTTIINHIKTAHALQDMLAIFGAPGVGKTTAIRWYQKAYTNVWVVTFSPAITGTIPVCQEIAEAVGAERPNQVQGARRVLASLHKVFRESKGLSIVDEAHHLSTTALDTIRSLHDATGIAIALVGGVELQTKIQAMPQLHRRIGLRLYVTKVLPADVDALLDAWNLTKKETRKFLADVAKGPGALGGVTKTLRLASMVAASAGAELTLEHIKNAAETLAMKSTGEDY
jgi:DNA transposition AAA+ family ATPase